MCTILGRGGRRGRRGRVESSVAKQVSSCVYFLLYYCVCVVLGRGGRSGRSAEEDESTLVSSFSKTQYRSVSGERQPDSARLGSSRLGSSRLISKISQIKKWMVVQRQRMGASLSTWEVGRGGRSRRSVEEVGSRRSVDEVGSTLVSSFSKTQYRSVSGERQPDSARLSSARLVSAWLVSAHFQNFSDKKKGRWYSGNAWARRCRFRRSVDEVGR